MKGYEFLEEHEYFGTKEEFSHHCTYVFRRPLEEGKKRIGVLNVPISTEGTWDFYFSNKEIEPWFQELMEKSKTKSYHLFRLKKILEGKPVSKES